MNKALKALLAVTFFGIFVMGLALGREVGKKQERDRTNHLRYGINPHSVHVFTGTIDGEVIFKYAVRTDGMVHLSTPSDNGPKLSYSTQCVDKYEFDPIFESMIRKDRQEYEKDKKEDHD